MRRWIVASVAAVWLVIYLAKIAFEEVVTLGEAIGIILTSVVLIGSLALWGWPRLIRWRCNHAYTVRLYSDDKLAKIVELPKPIGHLIDPDPNAAMARRLTLATGTNHLYVQLTCHRKRQIIERWFWFEDMNRHILASNIANISRVVDMNVAAFHHLYDPKPPEIELSEPQGVGYISGEWEKRASAWEFYAEAQLSAPLEGFLTIMCKDSGGVKMYGRARITVQ